MTMADRIAVMNQGEICQVATPAEVYEAPATRFVADFIGNVNIFDGQVTDRDDTGIMLQTADGFEIQASNPGESEKGQRASFAIRPEKIRISADEPAATNANRVAGEVWDIAYLGDMTVFHVKLDSGKVVRASTINDARISDTALTWHDRAWISFAPDAGVVLTG